MKNRNHRGRGHDRAWTRSFFFLLVAFTFAGFLSACGRCDFASILPGIEARGHYIQSVPFYPQTESTCGPAALAQVLAFRGRPVTVGNIADKVYLPQLRGTLPMDLEEYAREAGFTAHSAAGTPDAVKDTIRKDIPVICLLDLGFSLYRKPHYVTAVGFDDEKQCMIVHDGLQPNRLMDYDDFRAAWDRAGRWMLVVTPKSTGTHHE